MQGMMHMPRSRIEMVWQRLPLRVRQREVFGALEQNRCRA